MGPGPSGPMGPVAHGPSGPMGPWAQGPWARAGPRRRPFPSGPFDWFLRREGGRRFSHYGAVWLLSIFCVPAENGLRSALSRWISLQKPWHLVGEL